MRSTEDEVGQLQSEALDGASAAALLAQLATRLREGAAIDKATAQRQLDVLFAKGDDILSKAAQADPWAPGNLGTAMFFLLRALGPEGASRALDEAMRASQSFMTMVIVCDWLSIRPDDAGPGAAVIRELVESLDEGAVARASDRTLEVLEEQARGPQLLRAPYPWWVLRFWKDKVGEVEPSEALLDAAADDDSLVLLAHRAFNPPLLMSDVCWLLVRDPDGWTKRIDEARGSMKAAGRDDDWLLLGKLKGLVQRCQMRDAGGPPWGRPGITDDDLLP